MTGRGPAGLGAGLAAAMAARGAWCWPRGAGFREGAAALALLTLLTAARSASGSNLHVSITARDAGAAVTRASTPTGAPAAVCAASMVCERPCAEALALNLTRAWSASGSGSAALYSAPPSNATACPVYSCAGSNCSWTSSCADLAAKLAFNGSVATATGAGGALLLSIRPSPTNRSELVVTRHRTSYWNANKSRYEYGGASGVVPTSYSSLSCDLAYARGGADFLLDRDECASRPCLNGGRWHAAGSCRDSFIDAQVQAQQYRCNCSVGYSGARCEKEEATRWCPYTHDGDCDEGYGCAQGTDVADCEHGLRSATALPADDVANPFALVDGRNESAWRGTARRLTVDLGSTTCLGNLSVQWAGKSGLVTYNISTSRDGVTFAPPRVLKFAAAGFYGYRERLDSAVLNTRVRSLRLDLHAGTPSEQGLREVSWTTSATARPAPFAPRPVRRALLTSQANPGSLYRCC